MRKIRLFIASSLDGYIARTSGEVDWLFTASCRMRLNHLLHQHYEYYCFW
ncbi:hypothetical protein FDUTEX481_08808 [Tolypothrix sp. PCC 7601]|nr:hypothetical protein FDUTEX481_08808 [Tolypothrix sp. PCC 7601]